MAEEADFEIDVYGDTEGGNDQQQEQQQQQDEGHGEAAAEDYQQDEHQDGQYQEHGDEDMHQDGDQNGDQNGDEMNGQHDDGAASAASAPQQGTKRKEREDLALEENATNALLLSELQWFTTEDEIRNLARAAAVETELLEVTFSEHKVNGKSKGQVYLEFSSAQSAGDYKRQLSGLERSDQLSRAHAAYHEGSNPFKTLPKDGVQRQTRDGPGRGGSSSTYHNSGPVNNFQNSGGMATTGGYQGNNNNYRGRGGYRGGMRGVGGGMGGGGYNQGYGNQNSMNHTYNNNNMGGGGFNAMGGGGFRGGFVPRGGAPNYRGRGGPMMGGGVGGNPMMGAQMGMGGMMPMNMMGGMGGMGMGFNNMPGQFSPAFFGNQGGAGGFGGNQGGVGGFVGNNQGNDWSGNPHGAKRSRGE